MVSNKAVILAILMLFLVIFGTLWNIHVFMKSESKCSSSFEIIKKCGCIPDENMAKLFNQEYISPLNLNYIENGSK